MHGPFDVKQGIVNFIDSWTLIENLKKIKYNQKSMRILLFSLIVNVAEPKCNLIKLKVELNYSVKSFTDYCSKQRTNRKGLSDKRNSVGNSYIFKSKFFTNVVNK